MNVVNLGVEYTDTCAVHILRLEGIDKWFFKYARCEVGLTLAIEIHSGEHASFDAWREKLGLDDDTVSIQLTRTGRDAVIAHACSI